MTISHHIPMKFLAPPDLPVIPVAPGASSTAFSTTALGPTTTWARVLVLQKVPEQLLGKGLNEWRLSILCVNIHIYIIYMYINNDYIYIISIFKLYKLLLSRLLFFILNNN
jgi:hypothetical protein